MNWAEAETINVYPVIAPMNAIPNSQYDFLLDLSAITGAKVFDALNYPLPRTHEELNLSDLGGTTSFEATKFRSTVIGQNDSLLTLERADILEKQLKQSAGSVLEMSYLQERIGKITGGIAKLKVVGSPNGELRERRDRAEDAIMAVRKSIEHGCLPGGGWMLARLSNEIDETGDPDIIQTLGAALEEPFYVMFRNLGYSKDEISNNFWWQMQTNASCGDTEVYDAQEGKWVDAFEGGILDSTPAVLEAIRNSLSIATLLGTLGGVAVFPRDTDLEREEAKATNEYLRTVDDNPANERL
jgi:chaperonin GroEL